MFKRVARGDESLADEMYSEVAVTRIHRLFELWDQTRPLENYVMRNLRWYAVKHRAKLEHRAIREAQTEVAEATYCSPELVEFPYLTETEEWLIRAKYQWQLTPAEMAKQLAWPVKTVKSSLQYTEAKVWHHEIHPDWFFVKLTLTRMRQFLCAQ
jgi:hypothetical protein